MEAIDPQMRMPRREVAVSRVASTEGRIRREPGLCVACGRCVSICDHSTEAGSALEMADVARPKQGTLRESGCTFCGLCVLVCPTGALIAPGPAGAAWLAARRDKHGLPSQVLPPRSHRERQFKIPEELSALPDAPGVLTLLDAAGEVIQITGVDDLRRGAAQALEGPGAAKACWLRVEDEPLYTQRETELLAQHMREKGRLPEGNDLGDDLFGDDLFEDDLG